MESLEEKYAQTLENSNLSLKLTSSIIIKSKSYFQKLALKIQQPSLISKEAGVSERDSFSYFKTKEGILEAILSTFLKQVIPDVIADFSEKKFTANQEFSTIFKKYCSR